MRRRDDLRLFKEFARYYKVNVETPFVQALKELVESTAFQGGIVPKTFKQQLETLTNRYARSLEKAFEKFLQETDERVYQAFFEEISSQLLHRFKFRNTEYLIDESKNRILKRSPQSSNWIVILSHTKRSAFELWKYYELDGLKLSDRIWKSAKELSKQIQKQVFLSVQTGMSARRLANQILATAEQQPIVIPQYLKKQIANADPTKIANTIARYIQKKQRFNAMRVARTEIQRMWRVSYVKQAQQLPFVKGIKWNLSNSHTKVDICDEYAKTDVGLGAGVYPPNAVPNGGHPAHPNCICYLTTVLEVI